MALQLSVAARNSLLDAVETAVGLSPIMRVWAGPGSPQTVPANCAAANVGTLLAEINLASDWASAASGGIKAFSNLPISDASANASGLANYFRIYASDGVTCHMQGSVTAVAGGGDITFSSASVVSGEIVEITALTMTAPGA